MKHTRKAPVISLFVLLFALMFFGGITACKDDTDNGTVLDNGTEADNGTDAAAITLTHEKTFVFTPTDTYKTGVFCRLFYHQNREKFYLVFMGSKLDPSPESRPMDAEYVYMELDSGLNPTGVSGPLPLQCTGDFAIASDGTYYYFLQMVQEGYQLTKFDADFQTVKSETIAWDKTYEAGNDQILNYTDGRLYLATLYDTKGTGDNYYTGTNTATTYPHVYIYSTDLEPVDDVLLLDESNVPSGGSVIVRDGLFEMVTTDKMMRGNLYVYQWDSDWNYLDKKLLAMDGQWAQGLFYEDGYYYAVWHRGEHGNGNVAAGIFDESWSAVGGAPVTDYTGDYNAQRPWIIKAQDKLYVCYDVETTHAKDEPENKDWQCHIAVYAVAQ